MVTQPEQPGVEGRKSPLERRASINRSPKVIILFLASQTFQPKPNFEDITDNLLVLSGIKRGVEGTPEGAAFEHPSIKKVFETAGKVEEIKEELRRQYQQASQLPLEQAEAEKENLSRLASDLGIDTRELNPNDLSPPAWDTRAKKFDDPWGQPNTYNQALGSTEGWGQPQTTVETVTSEEEK